MERLQRIMLGHGMLVILASMFAGFMLMFGLVGGLEVWPGVIVEFSVYGTTEGWVRAHSGGAMNGLLVMTIAFALPKLNLSEAPQKFVAWGFIYVAWSFTIFYWFGNAAGNRSLSFGDNRLGTADIFGIIGFLPALPSVVLVVVLLVITVRGIFSSNRQQRPSRYNPSNQ